MKSIIKKLDSKIIILQDESIKGILDDTYLLINISPDNLDASTVIFESMLTNVPIINIKLQKNNWEYEFEKNGAVISYNYDSNYEDEILNLINSKTDYIKQISKINEFLEFYLKNKQNASEELIRLISNN
jgi:predicted RNA-binding protein with PUA domain